MFGKALLSFLFALTLFTSSLSLPLPNSDSEDAAIDQLENLAQEDFGSEFIDTPEKEAAKLVDKAEYDYYKRDLEGSFPISFGDLITPSLGGTFNSFVTTDETPAPQVARDEDNATQHNHEDFLPAGLRAASLTGDDAADITPLQSEDPAIAAEISSLAAAGALPTSI